MRPETTEVAWCWEFCCSKNQLKVLSFSLSGKWKVLSPGQFRLWSQNQAGASLTHHWRQRFIDMFTCNSCKSCGSRRQQPFPKFLCLFILFTGVFISLVGSEHLLCAGQHSRQWTYSSDGDRPLPHRAQRVVEETDNKQVSRWVSHCRECEVLQGK